MRWRRRKKRWYTEYKNEAEEVVSIKTEGFKITGERDAGKVCMSASWKGGVVYKERLGEKEGEKGKREGEDTSAAAWFTDCTVAMETFVSPLFDPKWWSKQWCHNLRVKEGKGGEGVGMDSRGRGAEEGCWQKSHPLTAYVPAVSAPWGGFHLM